MHLGAILEAVRWSIPHVEAALPAAFRAFSRAAAPLAVAAFWQGIAIASSLAICLRLAPRMSAAHRFALWTSGFIALVSLPFLPLLSNFMAGNAPAAASVGLPQAPPQAWLQMDIRWSLAIAVLWVAASLFRAVDLVIHSLRLRKLWQSASPVELAASQGASLTRLQNMPGRRPVQICTTHKLDRPSVIGFFAPRILIPDWLLARLTPGELDQIVLHEAEHLRRADDWTNLFQKLCLVLFPLNPALWWIERRMCAEREMACDDGVIKVTRAPRAYAACLTSLAERGLRRRAEALSLGAWQRRPELVHRVHSILTRHRALSPLATRAVLGTLACGLAFGSVELARCPQFIAFVPNQNAEASNALEAARPQTDLPRLLNTAHEPVRQPAFAHTVRKFHAVNVKAFLPERRNAEAVPFPASLRQAMPKRATGAGELNNSTRLAYHSPKQEMLKAELPSSQQAPPQQEWIVLTTWEQVQTSNQAQVSSDCAAGQGVNQETTKAKEQPSAQATREITITRLIFRVIPVVSMSSQPASLPVRGGWLVLQL
ncbi:MAG: M56 family metallopeptidase [Terracidiphilus sp.]